MSRESELARTLAEYEASSQTMVVSRTEFEAHRRVFPVETRDGVDVVVVRRLDVGEWKPRQWLLRAA
jgi:hypothetical protein